MYTSPPHYTDSPAEPSGSCGVQSEVTIHEHGTDLIGQPIRFATGQFTGRTIRAELREIQKADLGRKYAKVDRRPLDPPPVVQLSLFEMHHHGTNDEYEEELDYEEFQAHGVLCTVDLFPILTPTPDGREGSPHSSTSRNVSLRHPDSPERGTSNSPSNSPRQHVRRRSKNLVHPYSLDPSSSSTRRQLARHRTSESMDEEIIHRLGNYAVTENTKQTHLLVGSTFVQPNIIEYRGRKNIFFVFADLAVRTEGNFLLRYRAFDLSSYPEGREAIAIQAQCYGGAFRVYSTKEFPGLQASTELTKHLAQMGIRLNTRETERRRNKRSIDATSPGRDSSRSKRQQRDSYEEDDS